MAQAVTLETIEDPKSNLPHTGMPETEDIMASFDRAIADGYFRAEVYIDGRYHASLVTGASGAYAESTVSIPPLAGRHTLQLEFYGEFTEAKLDEFVFTRR